MKRWYINHEGLVFTCSLLGLAGKSKVATFRSDCDHIFHFQFMKFFDFANCKAGKQQTGWTILPDTETKVRAQIIFK